MGGSRIEKRKFLVKLWRASQAGVKPDDAPPPEPEVPVEPQNADAGAEGEEWRLPDSPAPPTPELSVTPQEQSAPPIPVSKQEERILKFIEEGGVDNDKIAAEIGTSVNYVQNTISRLYVRFGLHSKEGQTRAERRGLLTKAWRVSEAQLRASKEASAGTDPEPEADPYDDELYEAARVAVIKTGRATVSFLQMKLKIGYQRASWLMMKLEERGVIGPYAGPKPRSIIVQGADGESILPTAPAAPTHRQGSTSRTKFSDEEKIGKLEQLRTAVGDDSQLAQVLAEVIEDLRRMEKMRQVAKLFQDD